MESEASAVSGVGVLDKSVAILQRAAVSAASLADLVNATGIPRPTAHRLASALCVHDLLRRTSDGRFCAGPALLALGRAAAGGDNLSALARPILQALRDTTGESAQLYVESGGRRVCVASVEAQSELRTIVDEGTALPLDRGSGGRALSGRVGPDGWVESVAERAEGVASVSAPVRDRKGAIVAAVSLSGPIERMTAAPGARFGAAVVTAAAQLEAVLA